MPEHGSAHSLQIIAGGETVMNPLATSKLEDDIAGQKMDNYSRAYLTSTDPSKGYAGSMQYDYLPAATAKYTRGLAAVEWVRGSQTVLAFRGSYTNGDFANIENWFLDYVMEKSTDKMSTPCDASVACV